MNKKILSITLAIGIVSASVFLSANALASKSIDKANGSIVSSASSDEEVAKTNPATPATTAVLDINPAESKTESTASASSAESNGTISQQELYDRMLNSIDYYDTAEGEILTTLGGSSNATMIDYATNMLEGSSYLHVNDKSTDTEEYCEGTSRTTYNNKLKSFIVRENDVVKRSASTAIAPQDRITTEDDGYKNYHYRSNATNTNIASSISIFPQEMAFGFLSDTSLWSITGQENYLGIDCSKIEGKTEKNYGQKLNVDHFVFLVDPSTGILLKYEGYSSDGKLTDYMTTKQIKINNSVSTQQIKAKLQSHAGYAEKSN